MELYKLLDKYSSILNPQIESNLYESTSELFAKRATDSLISKNDFSFQTNFDKEHVETWRKKFAEQSFETHLFFLYVDNIEICKQRVAKRVSFGGHPVSTAQIIERYHNGLVKIDNYFDLYDHVRITDVSGKKNELILDIKFNEIITIDKRIKDIVDRHSLENLGKRINELT